MSKARSSEKFRAAKLPHFESEADCRGRRKLVWAADTWREMEGYGPVYLPTECFPDEPCDSGLCNVCIRRARLQLLKFAYEEKLFDPSWLFVTVFIEGWTIRADQLTPFGPLGQHRVIASILQRFRRLEVPGTIVIGAIETVYKVIGNVPQGKPFHLHFLVKGPSEQQVRDVLSRAPLDQRVPKPIDIQPAAANEADFLRRLGYVFKQPLWKNSKAEAGDLDRYLQWPKRRELAELISVMGAHHAFARMFLLGVRRDHHKLRTTLV